MLGYHSAASLLAASHFVSFASIWYKVADFSTLLDWVVGIMLLA